MPAATRASQMWASGPAAPMFLGTPAPPPSAKGTPSCQLWAMVPWHPLTPGWLRSTRKRSAPPPPPLQAVGCEVNRSTRSFMCASQDLLLPARRPQRPGAVMSCICATALSHCLSWCPHPPASRTARWPQPQHQHCGSALPSKDGSDPRSALSRAPCCRPACSIPLHHTLIFSTLTRHTEPCLPTKPLSTPKPGQRPQVHHAVQQPAPVGQRPGPGPLRAGLVPQVPEQVHLQEVHEQVRAARARGL